MKAVSREISIEREKPVPGSIDSKPLLGESSDQVQLERVKYAWQLSYIYEKTANAFSTRGSVVGLVPKIPVGIAFVFGFFHKHDAFVENLHWLNKEATMLQIIGSLQLFSLVLAYLVTPLFTNSYELKKVWLLQASGQLQSEIWQFRSCTGNYGQERCEQWEEICLRDETEKDDERMDKSEKVALSIHEKRCKMFTNNVMDIHNKLIGKSLTINNHANVDSKAVDEWVSKLKEADDDLFSFLTMENWIRFRQKSATKIAIQKSVDLQRQRLLTGLTLVICLLGCGVCLLLVPERGWHTSGFTLAGAVFAFSSPSKMARQVDALSDAMTGFNSSLVFWEALSYVEKRSQSMRDYFVAKVESSFMRQNDARTS